MPPRKSISLSTPRANGRGALKRALPVSEPSVRPYKRRKRAEVDEVENGHSVEEDTTQQVNGHELGEEIVEMDAEKELEAWQDFAAEHYEMVEQLPLELHRNFRLLRELDDGCVAQTEKLQVLMREYITLRIGRRKSSSGDVIHVEVSEEPQERNEESQEPHVLTDTAEATHRDAMENGMTQNGQEEPVEKVEEPPRPQVQEEVHAPEDMGIPEPDGQGGLLLPPEPPADINHQSDEQETGRLAFPQTPNQPINGDQALPNGDGHPVPVNGDEEQGSIPPAESSRAAQARARSSGLLPEIGRLAREIVRNGEEKVAVAVGAYNAIDRHIRALDSALSTQEASILLGLRPDTNPSAAIDGTLNGPGDPGAIAEDNGEVTIGLGGGGARKRGRRGKKGKKVDEEVPADTVQLGEAFNIPADPNEPRYCYCNQVSYGEMIGCENDECPLEWFHLPCTGLKSTPSGKWWCDNCKPKIGLGMGGAGTVAPRTGPAGQKKKKRPSAAARR